VLVLRSWARQEKDPKNGVGDTDRDTRQQRQGTLDPGRYEWDCARDRSEQVCLVDWVVRNKDESVRESVQASATNAWANFLGQTEYEIDTG